jgi:hypothetical protein
MITKIERSEVLKNSNNITVIISELQKEMFEDNPDNFETESDRLDYVTSFDAMELATKPVEQFYSVISFDQSDIKTFANELAIKIQSLLI